MSIPRYRIRYSTYMQEDKRRSTKGSMLHAHVHINLINQSTAISNSLDPKEGLTPDVGNN